MYGQLKWMLNYYGFCTGLELSEGNVYGNAATSCPVRCTDDTVEDGMASFTNQPPGDLHRPRAVRHPSPTSSASGCSPVHSLNYQLVPVPKAVSGSKVPLKRTCHTSTGQHLHVTGSRISGVLASPAGRPERKKRTEGRKSVTFQTDVRLKSDAFALPVVFETETEDNATPIRKVIQSKSVQESGHNDFNMKPFFFLNQS